MASPEHDASQLHTLQRVYTARISRSFHSDSLSGEAEAEDNDLFEALITAGGRNGIELTRLQLLGTHEHSARKCLMSKGKNQKKP